MLRTVLFTIESLLAKHCCLTESCCLQKPSLSVKFKTLSECSVLFLFAKSLILCSLLAQCFRHLYLLIKVKCISGPHNIGSGQRCFLQYSFTIELHISQVSKFCVILLNKSINDITETNSLWRNYLTGCLLFWRQAWLTFWHLWLAEIVLSFYLKHPASNQLEMHWDPLTKGSSRTLSIHKKLALLCRCQVSRNSVRSLRI